MKNHVFPRGIFLDRCKSSFEGAVRDRVPPKIAILRWIYRRPWNSTKMQQVLEKQMNHSKKRYFLWDTWRNNIKLWFLIRFLMKLHESEPRRPLGDVKSEKMNAKGTKVEPKRCQREPNGIKREPKGSKRDAKGSPKWAKAATKMQPKIDLRTRSWNGRQTGHRIKMKWVIFA